VVRLRIDHPPGRILTTHSAPATPNRTCTAALLAAIHAS
jgi:hypothetical protein